MASASPTLTLRGGTIVDGSGTPGYEGNLALQDGVITSVGGRGTSGELLDVSGCVVAPGFVDIHSHVDWLLGHERGHELLAASLEQGITTAVVGNCGSSPAPVADGRADRFDRQVLAEAVGDLLPWSWRSFGDYLDWVSGRRIPLNCAFLVGHGTVRSAVMSDPSDLASRHDVHEMQRLVSRSIEEGAFGVSVGLEYHPGRHAAPSEVGAVAEAAARRDAVLASHTRGISALYDQAMDEVLETASAAGCRLQISHVNPMGKKNWPAFGRLQAKAAAARSHGVDVGYDAVTYVSWSADIIGLLPTHLAGEGREALVALAASGEGRRLMRELLGRAMPSWPAWRRGSLTRHLPAEVGWEGLRVAEAGCAEFEPYTGCSLAEIAVRRRTDPFDSYCDWLLGSNGDARGVIVGYSGDFDDDTTLERILSDDTAIPETDTAVERTPGGRLELTLPLFFGTMPRFLGHFSRDRQLFPLESAVRRITSLPCERIGLRDRGRLQAGYRADVTVFDPTTVSDQGDYLQPRRPLGIEHVIVNGRRVVEHGAADVSTAAGYVLRFAGASART